MQFAATSRAQYYWKRMKCGSYRFPDCGHDRLRPVPHPGRDGQPGWGRHRLVHPRSDESAPRGLQGRVDLSNFFLEPDVFLLFVPTYSTKIDGTAGISDWPFNNIDSMDRTNFWSFSLVPPSEPIDMKLWMSLASNPGLSHRKHSIRSMPNSLWPISYRTSFEMSTSDISQMKKLEHSLAVQSPQG